MHAPQPAPRPTVGMIILLGGLTAFGAMSIDMYLPGLPAIGTAFGTDMATVQATMVAFLVGMAIGQLVYGPLSDRIGRRPALLSGAVIYVAASLLCALAPSIEWLIAGRFVQALGACAGQVVTRAVVRDLYDQQETARVFSFMILVFGVAPMIAPSIGALLLEVADWRAIFVALAVFGAAVGVGVVVMLPESRSSATAALANGENVFTSFATLLRQRRLLGYVLAGAMNGATVFTYIASAPGLLIVTYGLSPREFGWIFALIAGGLIAASQFNRVLLRRFPADAILAASSLGGIAISLGLVALALSGVGGVWGLIALLFALLSSFGLMVSNANAGALSVDPSRAGAVSALLGAVSFGVGALASVVTGVFHDGTAVPMAVVIALAQIGAALALFGFALPPRVFHSA